MAETWTEDQLKVLNAKKRNVLVSAAAGSGKTTVLIERIMRMICDGEAPIDVDRLLIVTFTEAAAGEMRARLRKSLLSKLEKDPGNAHLHRQLLLLPRARVSTIHSFCAWILQNYFHVIDLEPGFRVGDDAEMSLLKSDVMQALLEDEYRKGEENFINFTEIVAAKKRDDEVEKMILRLYQFSESAPYPEEWLEGCLAPYRITTEEELYEAPWYRSYFNNLRAGLRGALRGYDSLISKCRQEGGPSFCIPDFQAEAAAIKFASEASTVTELRDRLPLISFPQKKKPPKGFPINKELNDRVTKDRGKLKESVDKIRTEGLTSPESILREIRETEPEVRELCRLTARFTSAFAKAKRKKNLLDFSDLEHFAIRVLRNPDHTRSEVAKSLAASFEEIMIDEYQDSNAVQEEILTAVSRIDDGRNNMFMVGDMKQSIYRFRMARPELFMGKYESFTEEESPSQKIELHANFRSRPEVVDGVNFFFRQLMHREVGGIEYDRAAELRALAAYTARPEADYSTELLLIRQDSDSEQGSAGSSTGNQDPAGPEETVGSGEADNDDVAPEKIELEVHGIAREIKRITDPENGLLLEDKGNKNAPFRRAEYRDIVILTRSRSYYETVIPEIFLSYGIPVFSQSRKGFFSTWEIRLILNLLRVIDNPIEDLALAAVLRSPIFGFTAEELAEIRLHDKSLGRENGFFGALKQYLRASETGEIAAGELSARISAFLDKIGEYREKARSLTVSALLRLILSDLQLEIYVSAMRGGGQRNDNIIALLEKAEAFENSSYHGLYHFVRYIERLEKTSIDEGETNSLSEKDNVVRHMTIHSSKGLEFPVVFLAGLHKQFNTEDENSDVLFHTDYGIGMNLVNVATRVKRKTLIRRAILSATRSEALGEELRVLYVAMTRAEQKLYLTAVCPPSFSAEDMEERFDRPEEPLDEASVVSARGYFPWITEAYRRESPVKLRYLFSRDIMAGAEAPEETGEEMNVGNSLALFRELAKPEEALEPAIAKIDEVLSFPYLYDDLYQVRSTMSVSLLKEMAKKLRDEKHGTFDEEEASAVVDDIPAAKKVREGRIDAAARGTLVHLVFEKIIPGEKAEAAVGRMVEKGILDISQAAELELRCFDDFYESSLGKRCEAAFARGQLYRERRFIIGLPVNDVLPEARVRKGTEELLMLQGTTDLYFEEPEGLVLVDYKTDRVKDGAELLYRYKLQLDLYERALVQSTGKPVTEKWIWSTTLRRAIKAE